MTKARNLANLLADGAVGADELASTLDLSSKTLTLPAGTALPSQSGQNGNFLTTDGTSASWGAVDTSAAGNDTELQYNNAGARAGASGLVTDGSNLTIKTQGDLRFGDSDDSNYVGFQAPATVAANKIWTLPDADGTNGQVLSTNGSGTLSWSSGAAPGPFADGSADSPSITFASDTNTGVFRAGADRIGIATNGVQRFAVEDNGQVSVNTGKDTTYLPVFSVYKNQEGDVTYAPFANSLTSFAATVTSAAAYAPANSGRRQVGLFVQSGNNGGGYDNFVTGSHWSPKDAAVLATNGGGVGNQGGTSFFGFANPVYQGSHAYSARVNFAPTSGTGIGYYVDIDGHTFSYEQVGLYSRILSNANSASGCVHVILNTEETTSSTRSMIHFRRANSNVGSVTTTNNSTAYNTSSDYRLKENIVDLAGGIDSVLQMNPVAFDWKSGGSSVGFIAHELQSIVPEAVSGEKDAYEPKGIVDENGDPVLDAEGNPQTEPDLDKPLYQGVDSSFLVPHLVKAVQELKGIIDTQASTITALEARVAALESGT